jgi:hypothetical protein
VILVLARLFHMLLLRLLCVGTLQGKSCSSRFTVKSHQRTLMLGDRSPANDSIVTPVLPT